MSDLSSDPTHGGVTDDMMEEFFAGHPDLRMLHPVNPTFDSGVTSADGVEVEGEPSTPPAEPQPEPEPQTPPEGEPQGPEGEPAEPEGPAEPTEDFYDLDGARIPRSQVDAAARFQQHLENDYELQNLIRNYLAGTAAQPAPAASPVDDGSSSAGPPQELDLDDPQIAALYQLVNQQQDQLAQFRTALQQTAQIQQNQQRNEVNGLWIRASESFGKDHGLDANEVDNLGRVAARLGVIPQLMSGVDPINGTPVQPDPLKAFDRALEIAMMMVPEYRDREFRRSVEEQQEQAKKKKLLGAVGGSSGSVARTTPPPRPGSPESKRAMLAEVGAMINGEWSDPTAN